MEKTCAQCSAAFEITPEDLAFYEAVSPVYAGEKYDLPPPTFCPECRYQERLIWRNERNIYRNTCKATGKPVVSIFSPDKTWPPVFEQKYWWGDAWDRFAYGKKMDFSRPFFEQWAELFQSMPQLAMNNQNSDNCEYTNQSQNNKDCYMIFCSGEARDCLHGMWLAYDINCIDCLYLERSELCYEVVSSANCYHCMFSQNLENCSYVSFSRNCIGCKNCFGCVNLRNKEYFFFNEQLSKENYEMRLKEFPLHSFSSVQMASERFAEFSRDFPRKYYVGANIENVIGDYLLNDKNAYNVFNCRNAEDVHHCQDVWRARNCRDMTETADNDFSYSVEGVGQCTNALFSKKFAGSSNVVYCSHCNYSKNLFGCVGLNHAQYCILNTQYTKQEYEILVPQIIEHMRRNNEWGRHFPPEYSPFGYNETVAQEYFPLTKEEATVRGYRWSDYDPSPPATAQLTNASRLPDSIGNVSDDVILSLHIACEATARLFKIIKQELEFYRKMQLPLPRLHPDERHRRRMAMRNPRKLWTRECMNCKKAIQTTYSPEKPEIVYCEECYLQTVN